MIKVKSMFGRKLKTRVRGTETSLRMEIAIVAACCIRDFVRRESEFNRMRDGVIDILRRMQFSEDENEKIYLLEDDDFLQL